jgi:hypothetical protein
MATSAYTVLLTKFHHVQGRYPKATCHLEDLSGCKEAALPGKGRFLGTSWRPRRRQRPEAETTIEAENPGL